MPDTIFHKIAAKEAPAFIIMEDAEHMAFLDIFPSVKAQTVVIPKAYQPGKFSEAEPEALANLMNFAQKVSSLIEAKVPDVIRCQIVVEGFEIDYLHVKIFPAYRVPEDCVHHSSKVRADDKELSKLQGELTA